MLSRRDDTDSRFWLRISLSDGRAPEIQRLYETREYRDQEREERSTKEKCRTTVKCLFSVVSYESLKITELLVEAGISINSV